MADGLDDPSPPDAGRSPPTQGVARAMLWLAGGAIVVLGVWWFAQPTARTAAKNAPEPPPFQPMTMTPWIMPGIKTPPVQSASAVDLPDDTEVVGIIADGKARAYRLEALAPMDSHVVNDLIGEVPVSVTFCNRTDCVQAYTDKQRGKPLDIHLGGYMHKMFLKVDDAFFFQDDGKPTSKTNSEPMPHDFHAFERTTWKKWRDAHPTTEIYVGKMQKKKM